MSRTRPPSLQNWSPLHSRSPLLKTPPLHAPHKPTSSSSSSNRPFHTTRPTHRGAVPMPSRLARSPARRSALRKPTFPADALLGLTPQKKLAERVALFEWTALKLLAEMLHDGIIGKEVTPKTFKRVGAMLLERAYTEAASAEAVKEIAQETNIDIDTVFEIGRAITRGDKGLSQWVITSCTHAGARMALCVTAANYLRSCHGNQEISYVSEATSVPIPTSFMAQIERLALQARDDQNPDLQAMALYAKYLGLRGRHEDGIALAGQIMKHIYPTRLPQPAVKDLTISGLVEPPWKLYIWLRHLQARHTARRTGGKKEIIWDDEEKRILLIAALEFQDPGALRRYADTMRLSGKWKEYEEYMSKAAAAGNPHACRKLGHYYYLKSIEHASVHPGTVEGDAEVAVTLDPSAKPPQEPKGAISKTLSYFRPRPLSEYRALATEFLRLAFANGCAASGVRYSILCLQDGKVEEAEAILNEISEDKETVGGTQQALARGIMNRFTATGEIKMALSYLDL
ncbi:hypothetical protein BJX61DRAFT_253198 [Aspergillus egyptiacus]|nr:hypothetical protein BJX61DRAFT_253198 [Aspergillus egyptiacus]